MTLLRVLVVVNQVTADQSALWEAAGAIDGTELHLVGAPPTAGLDAYEASDRLPDGIRVHLLRPRAIRPHKDSLWWVYPGLREVVRTVRPDLVHVHSELWGLLVAQALRVHPHVVAHGADNQFSFGGRAENAIRQVILRRHLRRLLGYVSWNRSGATLAERRRSGLATLVVPGIPSRDPGERVPTVDGALRVGFIGRFSPEKGLGVLLDALRRLPVDLRERTVLEVIGAGEQGHLLDDWDATALDRRGPLPHAGTMERLRHFTVLVVPSQDTPDLKEQFGRAAVEAMSLAVPVVAGDAGALPEVIGDAGHVVPQADVGAMAAAIAHVLQDPAHRRELAARGRARYAATQRPDLHARRLVDFWRGVLP